MRALALALMLFWPVLVWLPPPARADGAAEEAERDRSFLSDMIEGMLTTEGQIVRIDGFRGALSSHATVARLSIADAGGEWLIARDLALDWTRAALFDGRLEIDRLSAGSIDLIRSPEGEAPPPSPESVPFALPELPVAVRIGDLSVGRIVLGAALTGQEVVLSLDGEARLAGGEGGIRLNAARIGGAGDFRLEGSFSNATRVLGVDLALSEGAGGIAATLLALPGAPALDLTVTGTAPIDDYRADLRLASDGEDRVTGRFGLVAVTGADGATGRGFSLDLRGDVTPLLAPDYRAFFGSDVTLALVGQSAADGSLELSSLGVAAQAVRLTGDALLSPGMWPERLHLRGDIGLPGGGPVILPIGGDPVTVGTMTLAVDYDHATGDTWSAALDLGDLAGPGFAMPALALSGGGTLTPEDATGHGALTLAMDYAARGLVLDDPGLARAVGPDVTGHLVLSRRDGGPVILESLGIDGPGIGAALSGTIGGGAGRLAYDLGLDLRAGDLARFDLLTGLALQGAADLRIGLEGDLLDRVVTVDLAGTTRDLVLGIPEADALLAGAGEVSLSAIRDAQGLRIEGLHLATAALEVAGGATLTSGASRADLTLTLDDAGRLVPGLAGPVRAEAVLADSTGAGLSVEATAHLPGAETVLALRRAPGAGALALDLRGTVPDLAAYAALAGTGLGGAAQLRLLGTITGAAADLDLSATTTDLSLGEATVDRLLAGVGRIGARIRHDGAGTTRIEGLEIATPRLAGTGHAGIAGAGADLRAALDLTLPELAGLIDGADGLAGPARVQGTMARDGAGTLALDLSAEAMGTTARVLGTLAGGRFTGEGTAGIADVATLAALSGMAEATGAVDLRLTGEVATDLSALALTLDATTRDLDPGQPLLAPLLAGRGSLSGRVTRDDGGPFTLSAVTVETPALHLTAAGETDLAAIDATLDLTLHEAGMIAPGLSGPATLAGRIGRAAEGALTLDLDATVQGAHAALVARSEGTDPMSGMTGRLVLGAEDLAPFSAGALRGGIEGTVSGRLVPRDLALDLTLEASLRDLDPGQPELARVLAGVGRLSLGVERDAAGRILVRDLDLAMPNLTARATLDGRGDGPVARFDARLADVGLLAPDFSGPATAQGTARLSGENWMIEAAMTGPGGMTADLDGRIGADGRPDLRATGTLPLGLMNAMIEPQRLAGQAGFDLRLAGTSLDALSGSLRLSGAEAVDPSFGIRLTGIDGSVTLAGGRATTDLSARVDGGGSLRVQGPVTLSADMPAALHLQAGAVALRDPELYDTTATGEIRIDGPLAGGARFSGRLDLGPTELRIPSSGVGGLGDLPPVVHLGTPGAVAATLARAGLGANGAEAVAASGGLPYALDILISAPARIFIRGRGLDAELGGELRLGGTSAAILPSGGFALIRGRLDILQQRFTLSEGRADIQGDFMPWLHLAARTEARTGTVVTVTLEGPADAPQVTFSSVPDLPQDEVLAQLLFGRDLASITPLQAVQLAAAVGTLAGRGGGGIIDGLRTGLGVDDLDVVTGEDGGTALRLGTYLGENVYTDVTIGSEAAVNIHLDLTQDITVSGSASGSGETSLGIFFERDY
ncbi:MAG: translocation/assembly module TamB domain-containing protein [Rubellimicrobium sp.]|nr:translocation/assembly module TamB domain-containing protein [Rubellimicrobium sp.]